MLFFGDRKLYFAVREETESVSAFRRMSFVYLLRATRSVEGSSDLSSLCPECPEDL